MRDIWTKLHDKGYRCLNEGSFGSVWERPGYRRLLKVCTYRQDGWPAYARFCQRNPAPWALRVYHIWTTTEGLTLAIIERCVECIANNDGMEFGDNAGDCHDTVRRILYDFLPTPHSFRKPDMVPWLFKLRAFATGIYHTDVHGYNAMLRTDRSYVLIDPLASAMVDNAAMIAQSRLASMAV